MAPRSSSVLPTGRGGGPGLRDGQGHAVHARLGSWLHAHPRPGALGKAEFWNVDLRMRSSRLHAWCCLFFQGLLWLWQDTQDPGRQSWCCAYTSMILTEGDFFCERKIRFKTLLCCSPGVRPDVRAPQAVAGITTSRPQQSRVSLEQGSMRRDLFGKE